MIVSSHPNHVLADHIPDAYSRVDLDWRVTHINENAVRFFDLAEAQTAGYIFWDLLPDWIGGRSYYELHRAMADRVRVAFEDYWQAKDCWFQITAVPVDDGISLFIRDISEVKRLEQALHESEDRFRSTFENAAVGIGHLALDGRWLRVNERLCEILGYSRDELFLRAAHTITHPDDLGKELESLRMLLGGQIPTYTIEKRFIHKFGTPVWVELTVSVVEPSSGASRYLLAFVEEISERRAAEENLRQQLVINRSITNSTAEGLFMLDSAGRVTFINPAAEELVGWSAEELLGTPLHSMLLYKRPDGSAYPAAECPITEALASGVPIRNHEDYFVRKDETFVPVICSAAPIVDPSGMLMGAVLAVHDESELKTAQTELKALYDREHRISETLQRSLLRMPPSDAFPNVTVETLYAAAWDEAQVGGDFCDALSLGEGKVGLIVGDVAGKGLAAAARTAEIKYTLRTFLRDNHDPASAIKRLNDLLATSLDTNEFGDPTIVSLALAVLDTNTGDVQLSSAGSEPALMVRANGTAEPAPSSGLPLGAFVESEFETSMLHMRRGDILMMVTDGITEARRGHEFFGYDGLTSLAVQARGLPTLQQVAMAVLDGAQAFAGGRLQDDACVILARRK